MQFALLLGVLLALAHAGDLTDGRGFGDELEWFSLAEGRAEMKATGKPGMFIVHKTWCGACKRLKPGFRDSEVIAELANKMVLMQAEDDEEPSGDEFTPDGGYVPRIFFLDPTTGAVNTDMYNSFPGGNDKYRYFYHSTSGIEQAMERSIDHYEDAIVQEGDEEEIKSEL